MRGDYHSIVMVTKLFLESTPNHLNPNSRKNLSISSIAKKSEMASEKKVWYINIFKFICYYRL